MAVDHRPLLRSLGLTEQRIDQTLQNAKITAILVELCGEAGVTAEKGPSEKHICEALYAIATKFPSQAKPGRRALLLKYVLEKKITTDAQLTAAFDFFKREIHPEDTFDAAGFETACGVGVVVTPEQIADTVRGVLEANKAEILEKRYRSNIGILLASVRKQIPWADGAIMKNELDQQMLAMLGPKTEEDLKPPEKVKKVKAPKAPTSPTVAKKNKEEEKEKKDVREFAGVVNMLHKPGENYKTDLYVVTPKTKELLEQHLRETGGQVRTRFPPEPNGILHIGHAKAMNFNFSYAKANGGVCFLRYDDTNPEAEEERYFQGILDMVKWLGWEPYQITAASDHFARLYDLCVELIKRGLAYADHQTAEEIKRERGLGGESERKESPWRNRPREETLRIFEEMRQGLWEEGTVCIRMKIDMTSGNPCMWDPVAFRVKFHPHVRTGDKWCVYPTYDFTHCLCDSFENISHSLCTVEFKQARESYYWLCNALDVYCPVQWEYSRLNLTGTVLSKRKILRLISEGIVRDWDDPRLYSLPALKRRGFTPEAINNFAESVGITTSLTVIESSRLDQCVRDHLNQIAPRAMCVLDPIKVEIEGYGSRRDEIEVPNNPVNADMGTHKVPFTGTVYIDRSDFRETIEKGYRRLAPGQPVGLKHRGMVIAVKSIEKDANGEVIGLKVTGEELTAENKPKTFIHWVCEPVACEVRLYESLLRDDQLEEEEGESGKDFMSMINKDSLTIKDKALVDCSVRGAKVEDKFQFERVGYFCVDKDSSPNMLVFNLIVSLKEDSKKV